MNKTVSEMLREDTLFCIPSYQRGYRWGKREITALLEDIAEFADPDRKQDTYLLQPVVVKTGKSVGVPDDFAEYKIVVDGQQRLTTLSIILTVLSPDRNISRFWDITNRVYLDDPVLRDLNKEFRGNAKKTIETWTREHSEKARFIAEVLTDHTEGKSIIFIEYELPQNDDEHEAFIRLNAGKIPLTSAELIRAQFMTSPLSAEKKMEIAKE